jgi:hypothetical protein
MNNLEKEFIPYELALELKELGFNEICFGYWYTEQEEFKKIDIQLSSIGFLEGEPDYILAPTYSQAFRWFRHEYALESYIRANLCVDVPKTYQFNIDDNIDDVWYDTYEEAELACLKKLIEIVKGGNK